MSFTPQQLYTEISTDPAGIGYAAANGSAFAIAELLNTITGTTISLSFITKNNIIQNAGIQWQEQIDTGIGADGVTQLSTLAKEKYQGVLTGYYALDPGTIVQFASFNALGLNPVADNMLTSAQSTALATRHGTRAEVLYGQGTIIQPSDVTAALLAQ